MANTTANLLSHKVGTTRLHYLIQDRKWTSVTAVEQIARGIGTTQRCTATVTDILPLAPDKDDTRQRRRVWTEETREIRCLFKDEIICDKLLTMAMMKRQIIKSDLLQKIESTKRSVLSVICSNRKV